MKKMYNVEAVTVTPAMIRGEEPWSDISMVLAMKTAGLLKGLPFSKRTLVYQSEVRFVEDDDEKEYLQVDGKICKSMSDLLTVL